MFNLAENGHDCPLDQQTGGARRTTAPPCEMLCSDS
jgi:hypothetical protein